MKTSSVPETMLLRPAPWRRHRLAMRVVVLLAFAALIWCTAADAATPLPMHVAGRNPLDEIMGMSLRQPRWFGAVLVVWGLICIFIGWKIIRWSLALTCAAIAAGAVLASTIPGWEPALAWITAAAAAVVFGICGYFLYQAVIALQGAILGGALLGSLAYLVVPHYAAVVAVFSLLGALLGLVVGWKLAAYVGIISSVLSGLWWTIGGLAICIRVTGQHDLVILALVTAAATAIPGLYIQIREYQKGL